MRKKDARGLEVSTERHQSIDRFEEALSLLHGYYGDPLAIIDEALVEEPDFLMGLAFKAAAFVVSSERRAVPALAEAVSRAEALIERGAGIEREHKHVEAARAWLDGEFATSVDRYNRLAAEYPRDALAAQISHLGNFYLGRSTWLRDHTAWALPHYDPSDFSFSYLLGMHAFGLEETNEFARAEAAGSRALELNRRDPWAIHALAHVYEMRGEAARGVQLYEQSQADWAVDNFFAIHNWWHLCLYYLEAGDTQRVMDLYDSQVRGGSSRVNLDLVDASALLWRLELCSVDVGPRWQELAEAWNRVQEERYYAFNDWHALMAYAGARKQADVYRVITGLERAAAMGGTNAVLSREVGLPACRGFAAFAIGDYRRAVDELFGVRPVAHRFGGSNAQRDILDWTLIEAATRAGERSLARSLVEARRAQKPGAISPFSMRARIERAGAQVDVKPSQAA